MKHLSKFNEMEQWQKNLREHMPELDYITFYHKNGKPVKKFVRGWIEDCISRGVYKLEDGKILEWDRDRPDDQRFEEIDEYYYEENN